MSGILIFSEDAILTRQLFTAGLELKKTMNQPLYIAVIGDEHLASITNLGADKIFVLKGANTWPESYAEAIASLASNEQISVGLIGGNLRGKDIAAKVAAQLKAGLVTEAQTIGFVDGCLQTTRLLYGGLAVATEAVSLPAWATIAPKTFDEASILDSESEICTIEVTDMDDRITIGEVNSIVREGVEIEAAQRVVCVGRGLNKQDDLKMVEDLAQALGAEIGCTRGIAEDYHWLPVERYIGISGQKIKPELYLSIGVSGQVQHVAGVRDSKIIVAVDSNEKAPIFTVADYGIVGDIYEVMPLLTAALKK
ncbi:MAG: electron transfer flavoprotein subunit alpha/FixB family protein [Syntrophomonadaceae bacterium]